MEDRELLEKAAKAAGLESRWDQPRGAKTGVMRARFPGSGDAFPYWSPLTDDGDALRLAVALGLFFKPEFFHFLSLERFSGQDRDDCHATRRAIVRAAAALA